MYKVTASTDGTKRIDFDEGYVSVIIPTKNDKYAVCVSCQIGCPVECKFCHTGNMGFKKNLSSEQIVDQIKAAEEIIGKPPYSVVFMGMGEPTLNFNNVIEAANNIHNEFEIAYRRITISTSCFKTISKLLNIPFNVAVSLHSPFDKVRKSLIPSTISVKSIVDFANKYHRKHPRKEFMVEYALMNGVNDSGKDIRKLFSLNWPKKTSFNFIEFNDVGNFKRTDRDTIFKFKNAAIKAGYKSFVRYSRGADISAACWMLDYK